MWSAPPADTPSTGTRHGAGDHDQPYRFGWRSRTAAFPFSEREHARLLVLRSRYHDTLFGRGTQ